MSDDEPLDPQAAQYLAKVRRLMLIASATTFVAVGAVLAVIGYRVLHGQESAPATREAAAADPLPAGAKVLSATVGDGHVVLTLAVGGAIELRSFDLATLNPLAVRRLPAAGIGTAAGEPPRR